MDPLFGFRLYYDVHLPLEEIPFRPCLLLVFFFSFLAAVAYPVFNCKSREFYDPSPLYVWKSTNIYWPGCIRFFLGICLNSSACNISWDSFFKKNFSEMHLGRAKNMVCLFSPPFSSFPLSDEKGEGEGGTEGEGERERIEWAT